MAHCINTSLPEYKNLLSKTKLSEDDLKAFIGVWQEKNGLDKFPTIEFLKGYETFLSKRTPKSEEEVKRILSISSTKMSPENFYKKRKLVGDYNTRNNTAHKLEGTLNAESNTYTNVKFIYNPVPRNQERFEERQGIRTEEDKTFSTMPKTPIKDFQRDISYYGDEQQMRQEEELSIGVKDKNSFDSMINYLNGQIRFKASRISKISSEISELKRTGDKDKIKGREIQLTKLHDDIEQLKKQIEEFEAKKDADTLKNVAMAQLGWVNQILSKENITPSELNEIGFIIDTWSNVKSIMYNEIEEIPEDMLQVFGEINHRLNSEDITGGWWRVSGEYIAHVAGYKDANALLEEFHKINDIPMLPGYSLDLSRTGNKLLSFTATILRNAENRRELEQAQVEKDVKDKFKKIKEKGKDINLLFQKDKDGNPTGNLTNRYAQNWWEEARKQREYLQHEIKESKGNDTVRRRAYERYYKWLKDNTESIDIRYFVQDNFKGPKGTKEEYVNKLKEQFGEKRAEEIIQQALESYERYQEELSHIDEEDKERWISENSPIVWFNQSDPLTKGEKRVYTQTHNKFTVVKPKAKYDNGKTTGWYDENYEKIEADEDLLELYNFVRSTLTEQMSYIPAYMRRDQDIHAGFLPRVMKEFIEGTTSKDFMAALAAMPQEFIESITSQDGLDHRFLEINPQTKMPYKTPPVAFITNIPVDKRSKDLEAILIAFSKMAINYKWKSRVEDTALLTNRFLNNVSKSEGRRQFTSDELNNMKKMVEYTEDVILYNKKKEDEGVSKIKLFVFQGKVYNVINSEKKALIDSKFEELMKDNNVEVASNLLKEEFPKDVEIISVRKKYRLLEKERDVIEEKFYEGKITEDEYNELIKPLEEEANALGKNLVFSKIGDKLLRLNQTLALGLNPFSAVNNYLFGVTSNMMWAAGRTDFTPKEMWKAYGMMWKSSFNLKDGKMDKIANLIVLFGALDESVEFKTDGTNATLKKLKEVPFLMLRKGDYLIKGHTLISMMLHTQIKDRNGNMRSLYDAYNEDGTWNDKEFDGGKEWNGNVANEEEMEEFLKFRNKSNQLIKKLHGNFSDKSPVMYKKYILLRMLGQFRLTWMAEGFASRFEGRKLDPYLEREIEGRYVTAYRLGIGKTLGILTKLLLFQREKAFTGVRAQDRALAEENMRKLLMEIYLYTAMFSVYLLAKAAADDDDDKNEGYMFAMNILQRTMADTTFYLSPNTFTSIINNPIPVLKIPMNAQRGITSAMELIFNNDLTEHEKEQKYTNITNNFPYINQYNRFKYLTDRVIVRQ